MTLPTFTSIRFRRKELQSGEKIVQNEDVPTDGRVVEDHSNTSEITSLSTSSPTPSEHQYNPSVDIKRATRARRIAIIISSFSFFTSIISLILAIIGNIKSLPVIRSTYFFKLDLSNVFPQAFSSSNLVFVNSIARSIGLHDFYQVGLWSYCEGYLDEGITYCSPPQNLYWFNPVSIILNELLSGATISLPTAVITTLSLVKTASNLMFVFFITGIVLAAICIFTVPLAIHSRWWSLPLSILTFITALLVTTATIIATVMFSIFKNVLTSQPGLNISAQLGTQMLVFTWLSASGTLLGFTIQLALCCCGASRRDIATGRRTGSKRAYGSDMGPVPLSVAGGEAEKMKHQQQKQKQSPADRMGSISRTKRRWIGTKPARLALS